MRIAQFCDTYPPTLDGVGRVTQAYCCGLEAMGDECYYIAPRNRKAEKAENLQTILYPSIPLLWMPYRFGFPALSPGLIRRLCGMDFDVLHVQSPLLVARAAKIVSKKTGAPIVTTFHSKYYDDFYEATHSKFLAKRMLRFIISFYNSCDEVWTLNEGTEKVLRDYGYTGEVILMPNGTDPYPVTREVLDTRIREIPLRNNVPVLLFVGQIDRKKNIESILRACAILKGQGKDYQLLLAGQGPDELHFRLRAKILGIEDRLNFIGFVSDQDLLHAIYDRADLLVFPSIYDNASMVLREAASMGTPALLIRGSCTAENIVDGENGYLCENTPEDIAAQILRALPSVKVVGQRARETIPTEWRVILTKARMRYQALTEREKPKDERKRHGS